MTGEEIRQKIQYNNKIIENAASPTHFDLNKIVAMALKDNEELRAECKKQGHVYENGSCIYCYSLEEEK